jgi:hypothetical protein
VDDEPKEWNFSYFHRAVNEMSPEVSSVGSIMAALVY